MEPIAYTEFTPGIMRPVFKDERGQFVSDDGQRVDGVWYVPREEYDAPIVVEGESSGGF